jgi:hypothetical protein
VALVAEEGDPLFFPSGIQASVKRAKSGIRAQVVGHGRIYLTGQRLIWLSDRQGDGDEASTVSIPLNAILSANTFFGVVLNVGLRLYMLYFPEESMLKWVTYLSLVSQQSLVGTGHRLKTSHY